MAIGDEATSLNYPLVPETGEEGLVRWGAREINRTRDIVALVRKLLPGKITISSSNPSGGSNGDIWFKYTQRVTKCLL